MWRNRIERINPDRCWRVEVLRDRVPVSYADAIGHLREDGDFRAFLIGTLAEVPFGAYFWETPPVTRATASRAFEFVLAESPALAWTAADPASFAAEFARVGPMERVTAFANLGGDAILVVPCPRAPRDAYPHLAAFARKAPAAQQHAFWHLVASRVALRLGDRPLWLSSSGLGVPWLHARIDDRPKYYTFRPFRSFEA